MSKEIISSCCNLTLTTGNKDRNSEPTAPVSMSYMRVPKLHQSTAFPWPIRCRISGALYPQEKEGEVNGDALARGDVVHTDTTSKKLWGSS